MAKLSVDYDFCKVEIDKLSELQLNLDPLPPKYQKLVAEIVMLRLFYILENTFASLTMKILSGATYLDGTPASVLFASKNSQAAEYNMKTHGRKKAVGFLKWTKVSYIKDNVRYLVPAGEHFIVELDHHGVLIEEMRRVRNRIAHNNPGSRSNYREIVQKHYGAYLNSITPGMLLLSPNFSPPLLSQYLSKSKILIKSMIKG